MSRRTKNRNGENIGARMQDLNTFKRGLEGEDGKRTQRTIYFACKVIRFK
jgi:hypothetical protein